MIGAVPEGLVVQKKHDRQNLHQGFEPSLGLNGPDLETGRPNFLRDPSGS